jgi:3-oxoacyl-[acyl-carrier protein] reductase
MDLELKGKVALVTGGRHDIGREISLARAREGAALAVNYLHSKAEAEATVPRSRARGAAACSTPPTSPTTRR